jgi:excinuclease UvrABC nuclease subunit
MSNQSSITATGASGTTHTFTLHALNTSFNAVGGVYLILSQNTVLYIGQTGDLSSRFDAHHAEASWLRNGADRMAVIGVGTEKERLALEADLIARYNPTCNG